MKILKIAPLALALALVGVASFGATTHLGSTLVSVAHADTGAAAAPATDTGGSLAAYLVIGVAFLGGLLRVLEIVIPGLRWLAPRTKTKLDDKALGLAESAHDRLDALEQLVKPLAEAPAQAAKVLGDAEAKTSQGGFSKLGVMLVVGLVGALVACAAVKTEVKAIAGGVVTCAKADEGKVKALGLQLGTEALVQLVTKGSIDWTALKNEAEAAGETQGIEVAACSFGGLVADLQRVFQAVNPSAPQGLLAPASPLDGSAEALASFQAAHGITSIVQ